MEWGEIPWLGVLVAVIASQVIGFLWYGPLFGKPWRASMGITEEQMQDRSGLGAAMATGIVASIVAVVALALLMSFVDSPDATTGWQMGLLAALLVAAYIVITTAYEQRDKTLQWISIGNQLVTTIVVGVILGAMW